MQKLALISMTQLLQQHLIKINSSPLYHSRLIQLPNMIRIPIQKILHEDYDNLLIKIIDTFPEIDYLDEIL